MYENEEYVNEYSVPSSEFVIAELGDTDAERKINKILGFTNNNEREVIAKISNSSLFENTDRLLGSVTIIDPAEKIRRMLM